MLQPLPRTRRRADLPSPQAQEGGSFSPGSSKGDSHSNRRRAQEALLSPRLVITRHHSLGNLSPPRVLRILGTPPHEAPPRLGLGLGTPPLLQMQKGRGRGAKRHGGGALRQRGDTALR